MLILALDTSLDRTAVALTDGRGIAEVRVEAMERGHAERLFPMVEDVLAAAGATHADVDRFAVTVGPGSFTGIRVGLAAARGFGLVTGKPVVGIDGLTALAHSFPERPEGPVLAAIDARRGEIYAALFDRRFALVLPPFAAEAEAVLAAAGDDVATIVGNGASILAHQAAVTGRRVPPTVPLAGPDPIALARLAAAATPSDRPPAPLYVRPPDAKPQAPVEGLLA